MSGLRRLRSYRTEGFLDLSDAADGCSPKLAPLLGSRGASDFIGPSGPSPRQQAGHMTEGRQPFTAEIKTLAKGPSTYDPLENNIRKLRSLPDSLSRGSIRPSCRPVPWSLTAAEALAKFLCRPVRDDRVTFRGRMEGAAGRAARKVEHAEGTLIEVVLRPLIDGEKDVVHGAEESRAASVRLETPRRKRQGRRPIARTGGREAPPPRPR